MFHMSTIPVLCPPGYIHLSGHHCYKVLHIALDWIECLHWSQKIYVSYVYHSSSVSAWLHSLVWPPLLQGTTHRSGLGRVSTLVPEVICFICLPFQFCVCLATLTCLATIATRYYTSLWTGSSVYIGPRSYMFHMSTIPVLNPPGYIHLSGHHCYKVLHIALDWVECLHWSQKLFVSYVYHSSSVSAWLHSLVWPPLLQGTTHRSGLGSVSTLVPEDICFICLPFQFCVRLATLTCLATIATRYYTSLWTWSSVYIGPRSYMFHMSTIPVLCPPGYTHLSGHHCYKVLHIALDWVECLHGCRKDGGSLVSLETPAEQAVVRPWLVEQSRYHMQPTHSSLPHPITYIHHGW